MGPFPQSDTPGLTPLSALNRHLTRSHPCGADPSHGNPVFALRHIKSCHRSKALHLIRAASSRKPQPGRRGFISISFLFENGIDERIILFKPLGLPPWGHSESTPADRNLMIRDTPLDIEKSHCRRVSPAQGDNGFC